MTKCVHEPNKEESECSICRGAKAQTAYHEMNSSFKKQLRYFDLEGNPI